MNLQQYNNMVLESRLENYFSLQMDIKNSDLTKEQISRLIFISNVIKSTCGMDFFLKMSLDKILTLTDEDIHELSMAAYTLQKFT